MPSKRLTSHHLILSLIFALPLALYGAEQTEGVLTNTPRFLGPASCSSSGCHGGAATNRNQFIVWSKQDFHSRSFATLTTARSARIAEVLHIDEPAKDTHCTTCHAPMNGVAEQKLSPGVHVVDGVSCETCHGPAEPWLRGHTRRDWTHAGRVAAGMHDLENLYTRANTCVACHQTVDLDLLQAGHPELLFELDGQSVSEPKHWHEKPSWSGPQTWLVGQAVALREMSWQLSQTQGKDERLLARYGGLFWLLQKTDDKLGVSLLPAHAFAPIQANSDALARRTAEMECPPDFAQKLFVRLASTGPEFEETTTSQTDQARRAERLVLALDRLLVKRTPAQQATLDALFKQVQSLPDFNPKDFAATLKQLVP